MRALIFVVFLFFCSFTRAQTDSLALDEVVISATKTERSLTSLPMPAILVKADEIALSGSRRLQDILSEQTGLSIVPQINGFGNGLQLQGLNPDYTLILIDGEPLIGRMTGNVELSRVSLGNIKRIEIIKGPSSSLYGSDALGGVVNILTQNPEYNKLQLGVKYGTNQTFDASLQGNYIYKNFTAGLFYNRFSTKGFDLFPEYFGQTVSPSNNSTLQLKTKLEFGSGHVFSFNARLFSEVQENEYQVVSANDSIKVFGDAGFKDYSFNPQLKFKLSDKAFLTSSVYHSRYTTDTRLWNAKDNQAYYTDDFQQNFTRPEITAHCFFLKNQKWTTGTGVSIESVSTSRYGDKDQKSQNTFYAYLQHEWSGLKHWEIISGIRLDKSSVYGNQFSPKLAAHRKIGNGLKLKASTGSGFKSPDFRYLYLNFRNDAAAYSVFGTEQVTEQLKILDDNGEILQYYFDPASIGKLFPEKSFALNVGLNYEYKTQCGIDLNFFHNELDGLIEVLPVAITRNQKTIYSYSNINRAYTQGLELRFYHQWKNGIGLEASAQLLYAKDRDVLDQINAGLIFGRDPISKESYRITTGDYFGLFNRSRHTDLFKLYYTNSKQDWSLSLRCLFKSKFGIPNTAGSVQGAVRPSSDINGNGILDRFDRFVPAHVMIHCSFSKTLFSNFILQCGVDNLFNYKDPEHLPNNPGRFSYFGLQYKIFN